MRFQVGKLVCELALDESGGVETRWFLNNGRRTELPKYLDAADRKQYRAGRDALELQLVAYMDGMETDEAPRDRSSGRTAARQKQLAIVMRSAGTAERSEDGRRPDPVLGQVA
jgi:hypothetical protein